MAIAWLTWMEIVRSRQLLLCVLLLVLAPLAATFAGRLAITEADEIRLLLVASGLRLGAVFLLALFIIFSMVREHNERAMELALAAAVPRWGYYLGKLLGYLLGALVLACACSLVVATLAPLSAALLWGLSLACELGLLTCFTLFFVLIIPHTTAAGAGVAGFYLLGRSIADIHRMALEAPLTAEHGVEAMFSGLLMYLLPDLSGFTRSEWLLMSPPPVEGTATVLLQTVVYAALLTAMSLIDLYRHQVT